MSVAYIPEKVKIRAGGYEQSVLLDKKKTLIINLISLFIILIFFSLATLKFIGQDNKNRFFKRSFKKRPEKKNG